MPQSNITLWKGSPNFWESRSGFKPEAVVIHIMDGTLAGMDSWFATSPSQVSAHYGIGQAGEIHQYVKEENAAWHAGRVDNPSWRLLKPNTNPNYYTIGIEHEGKPDTIWPDIMKKSSAALIRDICQRWSIPLDREHIVGHYQIDSVRRPNCPAYNKAIIDELISLARAETNQDKLARGLKMIADGLQLLKEATA